ncbi:MAG: alpha/beta fold hydrolase [Candidatus Dormibacteria bacterium]
MSGLAIHDSGEGPAVLLLHAFPLDASQWDAQVAALSGRYRCLRPDFWGCGASSPAPGPVSLDSYASDVLGELDRLGIDEFSVCGLSMGGYTCFALLRAARGRVGSLVLASTRAVADDDGAGAARAAMAEEVRAGGVESIVEPMTGRLLCAACRAEVHIADPVRGRIRRCTDAGVLAALDAMAARADSTALLAGIDVPTLVILGTADVIAPAAESRAMAGAIPGAVVEEFDGSAHLPNLEQPARFSALLGEFLDARATRP